MTLLAGIFSNSESVAASAIDRQVDVAIADNALEQSISISNAMDVATKRLNSLLDVSALLEAVEVKTETERKMGRYMVANALMAMDMGAEDASQATVGLESADKVGNEAFETIKQYAKRIIEWIQKKWKELKNFIAKYWNKYFGDIERLIKSWNAMKDKVAAKESGFSIEGKAKVEFTKGSDFFFLDTKVVDVSGMIDGVKATAGQVTYIAEKFIKEEVGEIESDKIVVDGKVVDNIKSILPIPANVSDASIKTLMGGKLLDIAKDAPSKYQGLTYGRRGPSMLGRLAVYGGYKGTDANADEYLQKLTSYTIELGELEEKQKVKEKVELAPATLADISNLIIANVELLERTLDLKRSKTIDKLEESLEKANKSLNGWMKNVPDEDAPVDTRAAYRKGLSLATAYLATQRKVFVNFPRDLASYARTLSSMQKVFCEKSLAMHKKDA